MKKRADSSWKGRACVNGWRSPPPGLKDKDLVGIPWRVAFALQAAGWYLRRDIIWQKPNPMPEAVHDRPATSHEYVFLLSKSHRYHYDADAVKERVTGNARPRGGSGVGPKSVVPGSKAGSRARAVKANHSFHAAVRGLVKMRHLRSVWTVHPKAFAEAHFATFPENLVRPCILAGCPDGGTVLDPFSGAGTTGVVAAKHSRRYIGIELNPAYVAMSEARIERECPDLLWAMTAVG